MSRRTELEAIGNNTRDFVASEEPTTPQWNVNPSLQRQGFNKTGLFFEQIETLIAGQALRLDAEHDAEGKHLPPSEWIRDTAAPTYIAPQQFSLPGDRLNDFRVGHRIRVALPSGPVRVTIDGVTLLAGPTRTVISVLGATVNGLTAVDRGLLRGSFAAVTGADVMPGAIGEPAIATEAIRTRHVRSHELRRQHLRPHEVVGFGSIVVGGGSGVTVPGSNSGGGAPVSVTALATLVPLSNGPAAGDAADGYFDIDWTVYGYLNIGSFTGTHIVGAQIEIEGVNAANQVLMTETVGARTMELLPQSVAAGPGPSFTLVGHVGYEVIPGSNVPLTVVAYRCRLVGWVNAASGSPRSVRVTSSAVRLRGLR